MSPLPHVAVITMARDEGTMLRRWVDHYSREVGVDNLVVVDDNSSDGSTDDLPCTVLRIPPLTQNGQLFRLKGYGMPVVGKPHEKGDAYARVEAQLPTQLSPDEREHYEALATSRGEKKSHSAA